MESHSVCNYTGDNREKMRVIKKADDRAAGAGFHHVYHLKRGTFKYCTESVVDLNIMEPQYQTFPLTDSFIQMYINYVLFLVCSTIYSVYLNFFFHRLSMLLRTYIQR